MTASGQPTQLPLGFGHRPSLAGDDFLVAPSNAEALAWIERWPDWPAPVVTVWGPPACGKTHLARLFEAISGARLITSCGLAAADPIELAAAGAPLILEDAERALGAGGKSLEETLFHLYNALNESAGGLLLTAENAPARWDLKLADLRSRLAAAPVAEIGPPGDAMIEAVLVKLFGDRQLKVEPDVISYLTARMERSFAEAARLVGAIDGMALSRRRNVTVPLVREVLGGHAAKAE